VGSGLCTHLDSLLMKSRYLHLFYSAVLIGMSLGSDGLPRLLSPHAGFVLSHTNQVRHFTLSEGGVQRPIQLFLKASIYSNDEYLPVALLYDRFYRKRPADLLVLALDPASVSSIGTSLGKCQSVHVGYHIRFLACLLYSRSQSAMYSRTSLTSDKIPWKMAQEIFYSSR
jgi:hypothetical protein